MQNDEYCSTYDRCREYLGGDDLAANVVVNKYLMKDKDGNFLETDPSQMIDRIASEFHRIEGKYPNPAGKDEIIAALDHFRYIVPHGSPLFGIGNNSQITSIANCFVIDSPVDSYGGIFKQDQELAQVGKRRGGTGMDISTIRPRGTSVNNAAMTSDGISCFMERFSSTTKEVAQCIEGNQLVLTLRGLVAIRDVTTSDQVWTKVGWVPVRDVLKNRKVVHQLTSHNGYSIKTSDDHVFMTYDGKNLNEKPLKEISITDDKVVMLVGNNVQKPYINLENVPYERKDGGINGMGRSGGNSGRLNASVILPKVLNEELAYILGYSYGDGTVEFDRFDEPKLLEFACAHSHPDIQHKLCENIKNVFGIDASIRLGDGKMNRVTIGSKVVCHFLHQNGLLKQKSTVLEFPSLIINSSSSVQGAFISGYFDADGYASGKKKGYCFAGTCWAFLDQVRTILLANGILCKLQIEYRGDKGWHDLYSVYVVGKYSQRMLMDFLSHSVKVKKCGHISKRDCWITPYTPKNLSISYNNYNYLCGNLNMSCGAYTKYAVDHPMPQMLVLDSVKSIVECEVADTYDLVLDTEHLFWCQGFYVHNSGRRGALLLSIDCRHPDILDFINAKKNLTKVTGANISVKWTDEFLCAVESDGDFTLRFPVDAQVDKATMSKVVKAKDIWNAFIEATHASAEPGCLFWDTIKNQSIADCYADVGFDSISTNPCGELILQKYGSCILMSMNLASFVKNEYLDSAEFNYKLFEKHVRLMVRLIDDMVDLEMEKVESIIAKIKNDPEPDEIKSTELNMWLKIMDAYRNGRRVGIGIIGLADMLAKLGIKYASEKSFPKVERVFRRFHETVYDESANLAAERGKFGVFDWNKEKDSHYIKMLPRETQDKIRKHGRRNISSTTCPPTGSISILTRTSSGIEPVFMLSYRRNKKITQAEIDKGVKEDYTDADGIKWVSFDVEHYGLKQWKDANPGKTTEESPYFGCTANDIKWQDRIKLQGIIQKYIDNSISVTTNLPSTTTVDEVGQMYMMAWKNRCKGFTIYREGSRRGVLEKKVEAPPVLAVEKRPKALPCNLHYSTISGNEWVFFVGLHENRPYEIFGGKKDKIEIPKKHKTGWLVKEGKGSDGIRIYSLYIGSLENSDERMIISDVGNVFSPGAGSYTRIISTMLRHSVPIKVIIEQLYKDAKADFFSFERGICRVLKKYVSDGEKVDDVCTKCNSTGTLQYRDGCVICIQCGDSKCS